MDKHLSNLVTEGRNENTKAMDQMSTKEILSTINGEDYIIAEAINKVLPEIQSAVEAIYSSLKKGGRLFYVGAGSSGRLGVLDAAECPPTFQTPLHMVQGIIAGGDQAIFKSIEGAEDNPEQGMLDLKGKELSKDDVVVGITASGRTPYPIGALEYARLVGAATISVSSNKKSMISAYADHPIEVIVGPEVVSGSTRMKAGTAHKMILNMLTTVTMIKLGKVYGNLMVDISASNYKLRERAKRIVVDITSCSYEVAERILVEANYEVKPAIIMIEAEVSFKDAKGYLKSANGIVRQALEAAQRSRKS